MELLDLLQQAAGGNALANIGQQFGLDSNQTNAAMETLAPVIAAGLRRNMAQSPDNVASLLTALQKGNHAQYLENPDALQFGAVAPEGNAILGHIFGSKDVSREIAMQAASSSGIGSSIMKKLLPVIATMVLGSLAKKMMGGRASAQPAPAPAPPRRSGGLGDILGQVLGGGRSGGSSGGLGDILGQILGGGKKRQPAPSAPAPTGGLDDMLSDMLGTDETSGDSSTWSVDEGAAERSRTTLDDFLGGGSSNGRAADDLLGSVERHLRNL
ncbi:MAG TPA: DUF937 domain-containing protein [Rhizobiales bacterium]|nr:DUF937 domain-containing protein [Hyphomicrobiales bacterium]